MKGLEEKDWAKFLSEAISLNFKKMEDTERTYVRLLDQLEENAKDKVFLSFIENTPGMIRHSDHEVSYIIQLLIVRNMCK